MEALQYLLVLVSVLLILYQLTVPKKIERKNILPSPPSLPVTGHFLFIKMLLKLPLHEVLNHLCKKYGPLFLLHMGSRRALVLSSRSDIEECFLKNDIIFSNRPVLPSRKVLDYNFTGFGAPYGNHWRNLRRFFAVEVFSPKRLQMSSNIRTEEIRYMTKYLFKRSFQKAVEVELNSFLYMLDFNIIMKMVAGNRCFEENEIDTDKGKDKLDDLKWSFSPFEPLALGDYFPFLRRLTRHGAEKKIRNKHKKRDAFLQAMLDARQKLNKTPAVGDGRSEIDQIMIDLMLKLKEFEPGFYSDDVMKGNITAMLIAGTHTTVMTMQAAISRLISHPEILRKARDEIDNVVGQSRLINDEDLPDLTYLHCIINETLRLDGVSILPTRESSEDCTIGGYHIPRGTQLMVNLWNLHRDPELWTEPDNFMPERFQQKEREKGGLKFAPFGLGRRICPGSSLANRLVGLSLGTLIQCFEWEEAEIEDKLNKPKKLTKMIFRPREALAHLLAQL